MRLRGWVPFLLFALVPICAQAQPVLVRFGPSGPPERVVVETYSGDVPGTTAAVTPSAEIVVALALDAIAREQMAAVKSGVSALYQAAGRAAALRIALVSGESVQVAGPFRTRAQLEAALGEIPQSGGAPPAAERFYSLLPAVARQFASGWKQFVVVGQAPALDPALAEYAATYLLRAFGAERLRVSFWPPGGGQPDFLRLVAVFTGGAVLPDLPALVERQTEPLVEVNWESPKLGNGFHLYRARVKYPSGYPVAEAPAAAGAELPGIEAYRELRRLAKQGDRDALERALSINAHDAEALRTGADFYKRHNDPATAAVLLSTLADLDAGNAALWEEIGGLQFQAKQWRGAEEALGRARELKPGNAVVAEQLGRIRFERGDFPGAVRFFDESLQLAPANQALWFLRADTFLKSGDRGRAAESLERGLALAEDRERRTALVRLYLETKAYDRAAGHVEMAIKALPPDAATRAMLAGLVEDLMRPDEALELWRKTLEADATHEPAHFAVGRLLFEKNDSAGAIRAADAGLRAAPQSARLQLLKANALERTGEVHAARRVLAAAPNKDVALLRRVAELEDRFGAGAANAYAELAAALEKVSPGSVEHRATLERGMLVSLRDGDPDRAAQFGSRLRALGEEASARFAPPAPRRNEIWIRGGLAALAFMARGKANPSPETFLVDYCRAIIEHTRLGEKQAEVYIAGLRDYFERVGAISGTGTPKGNSITVSLGVSDRSSQREAERILAKLGWTLRVARRKIAVEAGENREQGKAQEIASALALDEVGMKEALEAGKPFRFEIKYEWASTYLDEKLWREAFYEKEPMPGGLPEALAREPGLAKLYAGLSALDPQTLAELVSGIGLKRLAKDYADLLYRYSASLAYGGHGLAVPGGERAEPIWTRLAEASPREPQKFLAALLNRHEGKLLAFYSTVAELDSAHQRFITQSPARTIKFYELFRDAPELARGAEAWLRDASFVEFLREVPLDREGRVKFPGSPEVWMIAKGASGSISRTARMVKRLSRVAAPEVEDEILLRLARTRYEADRTRRTELDNFLGVVRIEEHRRQPLDEASALILAQHFAEYEAVYPYFAVLTGLEQADFERFFAFGESLKRFDDLALNPILAEWHSLARMIVAAQEVGAAAEKQAASLFRSLCERFTKAAAPEEFTAASLDALRALLAVTSPGVADADQAGLALLAGGPSPVAFALNGASYDFDAGQARAQAYRRVLELQKAPSFNALLAIYDAARKIAAGGGDVAAAIKAIDESRAGLLDVPIPPGMRLEGKEKENLQRFESRKAGELVAKLRQQAAKKKVNQKNLEKLAAEVLELIHPLAGWALSGALYAALLSPDDLLVAEDPLFLRKHQFLALSDAERGRFPVADLRVTGKAAGTYLAGGFADPGTIAGKVASGAGAQGGQASDTVRVALLGALRATDYRLLRDEDLRLLSLTVRAAREWIVEARSDDALRDALADASLGLLSLSRRRSLLMGIAARNWKRVWEAPTLSDLYFLGRKYLERFERDPWPSPVTAALRQAAAANDGSRLDLLGPLLPTLNNCSHPHLLARAPYEEFERYLFPTLIAERTAELKLYVADAMQVVGVPARAFRAVAEPVTRHVLSKLNMSDIRDWQSAVRAWAQVDGRTIEMILGEQKP